MARPHFLHSGRRWSRFIIWDFPQCGHFFRTLKNVENSAAGYTIAFSSLPPVQ
jgi:hypothetical protein